VPSADLSTILWRHGRFSVVLDPRNLTGGLRLDPGALVVHVLVFGFRWQWRRPATPPVPGGYLEAAEWMPGTWSELP
jgi:hypothetical protein